MFTTRWRLFRLLGIPIYIDASWLVILALLAWTLSGVFQQTVPELPAVASWIMGLASALAFFACVVLHELGHAVVARRMGIPIRGITLFLFGGVAELEGEPPTALSEFLVAIAGPIVSLVLAVVFGILAALISAPIATAPLLYLAVINLVVIAFNMLPAFPLDGGRVLRAILWALLGNIRRATFWASLSGQAFGWLMIGLGVLSFLSAHSGDDYVRGVWLGLIGLFLNNAARTSYQQVLTQELLRGQQVSRFMTRQPIVVPPELDLERWVEEYVYQHHRKFFPVSSNGHLAGIIATETLAKYPRGEWGKHTVAEAMRADVAELSIAPDADALRALSQMQRTNSSRLLVTEGQRLVGIISLRDLLGYLNLRLELEAAHGEQLGS